MKQYRTRSQSFDRPHSSTKSASQTAIYPRLNMPRLFAWKDTSYSKAFYFLEGEMIVRLRKAGGKRHFSIKSVSFCPTSRPSAISQPPRLPLTSTQRRALTRRLHWPVENWLLSERWGAERCLELTAILMESLGTKASAEWIKCDALGAAIVHWHSDWDETP